MSLDSASHVLVLLRHGHSAWNLNNRFTGWTDIPLTGIGLDEAEVAGHRLAQAGHAFDEAHVSRLRRTRQTAQAVLAAMAAPGTPIHSTWRLNERHYGALQGLDKHEIFAVWGEARAHAWWRGYHEPPPLVDLDDRRHPRFDPRYQDVDPALLPRGESLADCQHRTLPYWHAVLAPRIVAGRRLLLVSHGNTLRGLVMYLEHLTPEAMEKIEIPSGVPLVYRLDANLQPLGKAWLTP